jgi:hypothetical protein
MVGKLQLIEALLPKVGIRESIWKLYTLPHNYLTREFSYWSKRLLWKLYGAYLVVGQA